MTLNRGWGVDPGESYLLSVFTGESESGGVADASDGVRSCRGRCLVFPRQGRHVGFLDAVRSAANVWNVWIARNWSGLTSARVGPRRDGCRYELPGKWSVKRPARPPGREADNMTTRSAGLHYVTQKDPELISFETWTYVGRTQNAEKGRSKCCSRAAFAGAPVGSRLDAKLRERGLGLLAKPLQTKKRAERSTPRVVWKPPHGSDRGRERSGIPRVDRSQTGSGDVRIYSRGLCCRWKRTDEFRQFLLGPSKVQYWQWRIARVYVVGRKTLQTRSRHDCRTSSAKIWSFLVGFALNQMKKKTTLRKNVQWTAEDRLIAKGLFGVVGANVSPDIGFNSSAVSSLNASSVPSDESGFLDPDPDPGNQSSSSIEMLVGPLIELPLSESEEE
ncbi:Hypothetical predicted protein [Olea europaea subsp. europaea]|uniref:Uncharacterized protein n=1 Tax=Olea europaea subsp. europaea TaxID=158383 RepID=A0A8S0SCG5_OLEEU|nr:Hypothetical predicted protein [Olea europaea subsp. europaea]